MTREELQAVIEVVLGLHNTPGRVSTILAAADAYATDQIAMAVAGPFTDGTPAGDHGEIVRVRA